MHCCCICAILLAVEEKTSHASVSHAVFSEVPTASATEEELGWPCDAATRLSALILGKELSARPALPVLARRPIPPKVDVPDQGKRFGSSALNGYPFFTNRTLCVRAPAFGGTSTLYHGAAPAQEYRLRLKQPTPHAARGSPLFKSSTPAQGRALAPSPFLRRGKRKRPSFRFGKKNCALKTHFFPPKRNPKDSWRGGEETKANG